MSFQTVAEFVAKHLAHRRELREEHAALGEGGRVVCDHCRVAFVVPAGALRRALVECAASMQDAWWVAEGSEVWL